MVVCLAAAVLCGASLQAAEPAVLLLVSGSLWPVGAAILIAAFAAARYGVRWGTLTTAIVLGAHGWQTFWHVTLPNIRWGLVYGVILCNARAMGEFGAVSVVSGHIRGQTNTMPLHIEVLYNEYQSVAAFAVASLLALLALLTLAIKSLIEWRHLHRHSSVDPATLAAPNQKRTSP